MEPLVIAPFPPVKDSQERFSWPFAPTFDSSRVEIEVLGVWEPTASLAAVTVGTAFRFLDSDDAPVVHENIDVNGVFYVEVRGWLAVCNGTGDQDGPFVNCEPSVAYSTLA